MKKSYGNLYNLCMQVRERSEGCSLIGQLLTGWCMLCFGASPSVIMMSRCQILVPCEGDGVGERLPCVLLSVISLHFPELCPLGMTPNLFMWTGGRLWVEGNGPSILPLASSDWR